jgi:hypothetical protein
MFKITLGALVASAIAVFIPSRRQRIYFAGFILLIFIVIEVIFIARGGD